MIDEIWQKGEVNWTEVNDLERAIENLEDNTDNCLKAVQTPRVLGKWPQKVKGMISTPCCKQRNDFKYATI